jgi:alpha-ribazole phosphatase
VLILVRHGRTAANAQGLLQGRLDQDLDELGRRQAVAVADRVAAEIDVDWLVSSPLKRATQTAEAFGKPFEIDERWIELAYGEFEGVPHADLPSEVWERWFQDFDYVPPGGEALSALDRRVRSACDDLVDRAADGNVVVVSHVSPMKSAVAWSLGVDIGISWNCHLDHASICRVQFRGRHAVLRTFNETVGVD